MNITYLVLLESKKILIRAISTILVLLTGYLWLVTKRYFSKLAFSNLLLYYYTNFKNLQKIISTFKYLLFHAVKVFPRKEQINKKVSCTA